MISGELIFPTLITWSFREYLLPDLRELYNTIDWSYYEDSRYPNGVTTYFKEKESDIKLIKKYSAKLVEAILEDSYERIKSQNKDLKGKQLYIQNLWLSRMHTNGYHVRHLHHDSHFSGTIYVNSTADSSPIIFYDPRNYKQFFNVLDDHDIMSYDPTPGKLMLWDSFLEHEVQTNTSEFTRDAISFNVGLQ